MSHPSTAPGLPFRVVAIDALRALTMLLMIFVNDLGTLTGIPAWLEHVPAAADGMGLADIVFPGFLFIVGMSIPFAVRNRQQRGDTAWQIARHTAWRGFALLLMGIFLVNGEYILAADTGLARGWWNVIACTAFILIWNQYPKTWNARLVNSLKAVAALVLLYLAFIYRGGDPGSPVHFNTWWWGILGLIGWAYLVAALLFIWCKGNERVLFIGWLLSIALCAANHARLLPGEGLLHQLLSPIGAGAMTAFTIGGALASQLFWRERNKPAFSYSRLLLIFSAIAIVFLALGFLSRPLGGISKIRATPSWVLICSAISLFSFLLVYYITDVNRQTAWFSLIKPAGTETLLCYLVPYYVYAVISFTHWSLPAWMLTGATGLLKSALFAWLVVAFTGLLTKRFLKLRL